MSDANANANANASANVIEASSRIVRVTAYEDRADVVREAEVTLPPGGAVVVLRGLSAVISDEHVVARLEPSGPASPSTAQVMAHVNDVRVDRRIVGGDDELAARRAAQQKELEAIDEEVREASTELSRIDEAIAATETVLHNWARGAALATGRGQGDAKAWRSGLASFERDLAGLVDERAEARALLESVQRRRQRAADVRGPKPTGQRTVADVVLRVSTSSAQAVSFKLTLSTLVPCAAWRPTHEAWLLAAAPTPQASVPSQNARRVRFTTYAAVWNRTGESWDGVELELSTARPSAGAELPALRADRLTLRQKTAEERKTIVVEHREESVPKSATQGTAPGVDDGGQARTFRSAKASIPDDGRPHRVEIAVFEAPAVVERVAHPELVPQVFLRASLKNPGPSPILAGAVTLVVADGSTGVSTGSTWVGTGDVLFVGAGESFDLSFGSDDRFVVRTKKRRLEDKKLVGKDVVHFLREATLSQSGAATERVLVHLRMPVSEVKQLRVLPSPQHSTVSPDEARPDEHGVVRIPVELAPGVERRIVVAFSFETSGDVRIPDPW